MQPVDEPELTPGLIRDRYERLLARLRAAAEAAGRDPAGFRVVAVTKGFGPPLVRAAVDAGLTAFGENRVQEAAAKVACAPEADWHLVGHLQSNKVRAALGLFGTIHSVDSVELLERVARIAHDDDRRPQALLQVRLGGGAARTGFSPELLAAEAETPDGPLRRALAAPGPVRVVGIMAIASLDAGPPAAQFASVRLLAERLRQATGLALPELSMGMTADAELAVAEGATLVRVGTAIFGPRPLPAG